MDNLHSRTGLGCGFRRVPDSRPKDDGIRRVRMLATHAVSKTQALWSSPSQVCPSRDVWTPVSLKFSTLSRMPFGAAHTSMNVCRVFSVPREERGGHYLPASLSRVYSEMTTGTLQGDVILRRRGTSDTYTGGRAHAQLDHPFACADTSSSSRSCHRPTIL